MDDIIKGFQQGLTEKKAREEASAAPIVDIGFPPGCAIRQLSTAHIVRSGDVKQKSVAQEEAWRNASTQPSTVHSWWKDALSELKARVAAIDPKLLTQYNFYSDTIEMGYVEPGGKVGKLYAYSEVAHNLHLVDGDLERRVWGFLNVPTEAEFRHVAATFPTREVNDTGCVAQSWPGCDAGHMPSVSPRDQELANYAVHNVRVNDADIAIPFAQACAIARAEGFKEGRRYIPHQPLRPGTADSDVNCIITNMTEDGHYIVRPHHVTRIGDGDAILGVNRLDESVLALLRGHPRKDSMSQVGASDECAQTKAYRAQLREAAGTVTDPSAASVSALDIINKAMANINDITTMRQRRAQALLSMAGVNSGVSDVDFDMAARGNGLRSVYASP